MNSTKKPIFKILSYKDAVLTVQQQEQRAEQNTISQKTFIQKLNSLDEFPVLGK